jgi:hypothetical protein
MENVIGRIHPMGSLVKLVARKMLKQNTARTDTAQKPLTMELADI